MKPTVASVTKMDNFLITALPWSNTDCERDMISRADQNRPLTLKTGQYHPPVLAPFNP
jgi:hypothetical protein